MKELLERLSDVAPEVCQRSQIGSGYYSINNIWEVYHDLTSYDDKARLIVTLIGAIAQQGLLSRLENTTVGTWHVVISSIGGKGIAFGDDESEPCLALPRAFVNWSEIREMAIAVGGES